MSRVYGVLRREFEVYLQGLRSSVLGSPLVPRRVRPWLLRLLGQRAVAHRCVISQGCSFIDWSGLAIGRGTYVNQGVMFDLTAPITIGQNVHIGPGVMLVTSTHDTDPLARQTGSVQHAEISVGDECWLGAGVVILPGARISPGVIAAAGAIVTGDLATPGIYGGVPARLIKAH